MMSVESATISSNPETINEDDSAPLFPIRRFYYHTDVSREYYAYGNTLPEDLLESCSEHEPSILSLGCGDIRSCFYTLWKHFDSTVSSAPTRYDKVSFTLVDRSPAVLARNIVFIYLSVNLPMEKRPREKWLCGMWAIWYCHELSPDHATMLSDSLKYLTKFTSSPETWKSEENMLRSIVQFESVSCLSEIFEVLNMWFTENINVRSVEMMQKSRRDLMNDKIKDLSLFCYNFARISTFLYGRVENKRWLNTQAAEVRSYIQSGNAFAETIFEIDLRTKSKVNLTLYEQSNGSYTLHYGSVPFRAYHQVFPFTPEKLAQTCLNTSDVLVSSQHFREKPFLANSFQQFILWTQSVSRVLKKESEKVKFFLSTQDAATFCYKWQRCLEHSASEMSDRYNAIYTSNLMDYVGFPNLVLSCIPLLKAESLVFTTSMIAKNCCPTIEELLNRCFGFDCSLLPVLFGIRCINHEGNGFSSPVMTRPYPPDIANSEPYLPHVRKLQWEKISCALPLQVSELPSNMSDALVNLTATCAYAYLNPGPSITTFNTLESAILMLKFFIHCLDKTKPPAVSFWNALSSALNKVAKPFMLSLQTHLLLHELHIHLAVTEEECPLCNNVSIQDVIQLYSVGISKVYLPPIRATPLFYVVFYEHSLPRTTEQLLKASEMDESVHIFDCFDGISTSEKLELRFYVPLQVLHRKYKLAAFLIFPVQDGPNTIIEIPHIMDRGLSTQTYSFFQPFLKQSTSPVLLSEEFGEVACHTCNEFETRTTLSLSKSTSENTEMEKISLMEVRLFNSFFSITLEYNYPTDQEKMEISDLMGQTSVKITAKRVQHCFENECLHYIVSPDHQLSLLPTKISTDVIKSQCSMQFTREEFDQKLNVPEHDLKPLVRVKMVIEKLFKWSQSSSYIQICNPKRSEYILIAINTILFDHQLHTPALDLAFCVTEKNGIIIEWGKLSSTKKLKEDILEEAQMALLKATLVYFGKRTNGNLQTCHSSSVFENICRKNIHQEFSRAVVYFLLFDPDKNIPATNITLQLPPAAGSLCENCRKFSFTFKKCAKCHSAYYCSRKCQESNWKWHRRHCKKNDIPAPTNHKINGFFLKPKHLQETNKP